jgi:hypothetical protein
MGGGGGGGGKRPGPVKILLIGYNFYFLLCRHRLAVKREQTKYSKMLFYRSTV